MKDPQFKYKNGSLTPYAFACGYSEERNGWKLWKDGSWHVRRSFHEWESYDAFREAREAFKSHTRKRKILPKSLRFEYRITSSGDSWGQCLAWKFALADYLTHRGIAVPNEWQFRQSPSGPDKDAYEWKELSRRNDAGSTLRRFAGVLHRLQSILEAQGKDY